MQEQHWVIRTEEEKSKMFGNLANIQPDDKTPVEVQIGPWKANRSALQNRYLNGWIYKSIAEQLAEAGIVIPCDDGTEIPYTRDVLHEWVFGKKFRVKREYHIKGRTMYDYESTATMSRARFSEYVEQIRQFCYQYWQMTIPEPLEGYWASLLREIK